MNAPVKLTIFAAGLAALAGGGAVAGGAIDPEREKDASISHAAAKPEGGHAEPAGHAERNETAHPVRGVAVAENGLRLAVSDPELARGRTERLRFRIVNATGETVRDFDIEHTKRMHVIVARRDLTGFQHLHPEQERDGSWSLRLNLDDAGSYRLFADFSHEEQKTTLATDLRVDGAADLRPLPAPGPTAISDSGYDIQLDAAEAKPGKETELSFAISRGGRPITPEKYLGAGGHLVALREGDLAFLHVHPTDDHTASFAATFPTQGRYRLFLQFKHEGRIHTVAFTQEVK
jgi:hypothetical protein